MRMHHAAPAYENFHHRNLEHNFYFSWNLRPLLFLKMLVCPPPKKILKNTEFAHQVSELSKIPAHTLKHVPDVIDKCLVERQGLFRGAVPIHDGQYFACHRKTCRVNFTQKHTHNTQTCKSCTHTKDAHTRTHTHTHTHTRRTHTYRHTPYS